MLRKIANSCLRLPNKQAVAASLFSTSAASPLKYTIREAAENDYLMITRLRAKELWNIPLSKHEEIEDWYHALLNVSKSPGFHVIVAAEELGIKEESDIYGAVDLHVSKNAMFDVHGGKVPDEWKSEENKHEDAYLTDLAVAAYARRQHIAMNLLIHAKELAVSKSMKKLFAEVHEDNQPALALNKKLGYQVISFNDRSKLYLMGMKLTS